MKTPKGTTRKPVKLARGKWVEVGGERAKLIRPAYTPPGCAGQRWVVVEDETVCVREFEP